MLKITAFEQNGQRKLVLEGKLVEPWVSELEQTWNDARQSADSRKLVVDLKDVTMISEQGELLLHQMMVEGAKFNCCRGVLTRHVVRQLVQRCRHSKKRDENK